jgi:uncharacterized membrane protein
MNPVREALAVSGQSRTRSSNGVKRWAVALILVLAFVGIADSTYLARSEASGNPLLCNIESLSECNQVVASGYSKLFGVSLADYGLLFYTILFVLAAFELTLVNQMLRHTLQGFAIIGLLASVYSVVTQVFLINALCAYCLLSAFLSFFIFILATLIEPVRGGFLHSREAVPTT